MFNYTEQNDMKTYNLRITETLCRTVKITADSFDEAMEIISDLYTERKIVLNALDREDVEIRWIS